MLIEGEAGVGKTAVLERACDQAAERGETFASGLGALRSASTPSGAPSYLP